MASIDNGYPNVSVVGNQYAASHLDEDNYDIVLSTPTPGDGVVINDKQQGKADGEVEYHVLEPMDGYNFYEPSHGLGREGEQLAEGKYDTLDQPTNQQDVYDTPFSNTTNYHVDKNIPPQETPQVSDFKSASNIFGNNELQRGFTQDDTYNTLELSDINKSHVKSPEDTQEVYDTLEHSVRYSAHRLIHESNNTSTEGLKLHLKENTSNSDRHLELRYHKSKPVVLWIFKGLTILLLLAVVGMAYLFYRLNEDLKNNNMDLRNNKIKIEHIDVSQRNSIVAVNSSFLALNKTLIDLRRKQQSDIMNVSATVRKQNTEIFKVSVTVRRHNAEISKVNNTVVDLGRKQQSDITNVSATLRKQNAEITNVQRKEISDVANLTKWLHAMESRHRQEVNTMIKRMYTAIRQQGRYAVRFSNLDVYREGGAYKISANIIVYDKYWYHVCGETFTNQAANVFCKMGGFARGTLQHKDIKWRAVGKAETRSGYYYKFICEGSEESLQDCRTKYTDPCKDNLSNVKCYA